MRRSLVVLIAALALAACSSTKKHSSPGTPPATSVKPVTQQTIPPAAASSGQVATPDGNHYAVTITPAASGSRGCGTQLPVAGRYSMPFMVTEKNVGTKAAPEARMRFDIDDPQPVSAGTEVAAIKLVNTCVDYTAPGDPLH